jgi:hypothetical protein
MRVGPGREVQDGVFGYKPQRRVEPQERKVQGVASLDEGRARNTGETRCLLSINVISGVGNPDSPLLLFLRTL